MFLWLIAFLVWTLILGVCGLASAAIVSSMVDEVNPRLPENQRFSAYWWHFPKYLRLLREYRRLCPSGKRMNRLRWIGVAAVSNMALGGAAAGFRLGAAIFWVVGCLGVWLLHRQWRPTEAAGSAV